MPNLITIGYERYSEALFKFSNTIRVEGDDKTICGIKMRIVLEDVLEVGYYIVLEDGDAID